MKKLCITALLISFLYIENTYALFFACPRLTAQQLQTEDDNLAAQCFLCNCWHETRGESYNGKVAVARSVLARIASKNPKWPQTACGVIWQPAQFSWTNDIKSVAQRGHKNISIAKPTRNQMSSWYECRDAMVEAINTGSNGMPFFANPRTSTVAWPKIVSKEGAHRVKNNKGKTISGMKRCDTVGRHEFSMAIPPEQCPTGGAGGSSTKASSQSKKPKTGGGYAR